MGSKGGDEVTVGYFYSLGIHMGLWKGPIDKVVNIRVDEKCAWSGENTGGPLTIDAPELFGGEEREGGVTGVVDIDMGGPAQTENTYLQSQLGNDIPAFRGFVSAILNQVYIGLNPYLKPWRIRGQRIHVRQDGIDQWYDEKAEILYTCPGDNFISSNRWRLHILEVDMSLQPDLPNATWVRALTFFDQNGNSLTLPEDFVIGQGCFASDNSSVCSGAFDGGGEDETFWFSSLPVPEGTEIHIGYDFGGEKLHVSSFMIGNATHTLPYLERGNPIQYAIEYEDGNGDWISTGEFAPFDVPGTENTYFENYNVVAETNPVDPTCSYTGDVYDMNPAHIVRECVTDPDWGLGHPETENDDAASTYAADLLYTEEMGISINWYRQGPVEDFIAQIKKHINAELYVDRQTSKYVLKLIRDDYDPDALLTLDENDIVRIENARRPALGELINSVTVVYWDTCTSKDASVTVQDEALIQMQGGTINTTIQYPGFTNFRNAVRAAQRDLLALSTPLYASTIYAKRTADGLNIGDVFILTYPDYDISQMIVRITEADYGDGRKNEIRLNVVEDVFALPVTPINEQDPDDPGWEDPIQPPVAADYRLAVESPYYELVQYLGERDLADFLADEPQLGYVGAAAVRPENAISAQIHTDSGGGYSSAGLLDFCASCLLTAGVDQVEKAWTFDNGIDLDLVTVGEHAQIDGELVRIDAIDSSAGTITVGRGVLDTEPRAHLDNARIFFWDFYYGFDKTEYVSSDIVDVKILPTTGRGTLPIADAPVDQVALDGRAIRPYPPADLQIDGVAYPVITIAGGSIDVTWVHRDRLQQTDGTLYDHTDASIGPEAGTTYKLQIIDSLDVVQIEYLSLTGVSQTVSMSTLDDGDFELRIYSERDSILSYQYISWLFTLLHEVIFTGTIPNLEVVENSTLDYAAAVHFNTGTIPDSYSLQNEPTGMTIDNNGDITFSPSTTSTTLGVTVTGTNGALFDVSNAFSVTVTPFIAPRYWRIYVTAVQGGSQAVWIAEIEYRETVGGIDTTSPAGTATASSAQSGSEAIKAFDNDIVTSWHSNVPPSTLAQWVTYDFITSQAVAQVSMTCDTLTTNVAPTEFIIQSSYDNSIWTDELTVTGITWTTGETKLFAL